MENHRHPFVSILLLAGFFVSGLFISQFLSFLVLFPFLGESVLQLGNILQNASEHPEYKNAFLLIQGITSGVSMILAPYLFYKWYYPKTIYIGLQYPSDITFLITVLIIICGMPAITHLAELNEQIMLPEYLSFIENWAKDKENELKELTVYLTTFDSIGQFLFGVLVIAIIPAVGEELVFRGLLQPLLADWSRNKILSVWIAAIIFSAIHMQFYGFIPRMLLGALLGYMYVWTGNLLVPILAHFTNNGFTLFLLYMKSLGKLKMDVENTAQMPVELLWGSYIITLVLLYFYKSHITESPKTDQ